MDDLEAVLSRVRDRAVPEPAERDRLRTVAVELADRTREAIADLPVDADVVQVGSTARDTWVSGDRDIDLFVRFDAALDREQLEEYGLAVGHAVLPDGHEEYAEHPYVKGTYEGFDVDLVPCHDVETAGDLISAVDRTPFHDAYLSARLDEGLADDVVLAKAFLKGIGAYGATSAPRGSRGTSPSCSSWNWAGSSPRGVRPELAPARGIRSRRARRADLRRPARRGRSDRSDAERRGRPLGREPRSVPALRPRTACSPERGAVRTRWIRLRWTLPTFATISTDGKTTPVAVVFDAPDLVDDQLWPQLRRSLDGIVRGLNDRGFDVLRARAMTDGSGPEADGDGAKRAALYAELEVAERPAVTRHEGPPVAVRKHAASFYESYADDVDPETYGPFIDGDRYVVEREREFTTVREYLESDAAGDVALGAQVEREFAERDVLVGDAVATLAPAFGVPLREFYEPHP